MSRACRSGAKAPQPDCLFSVLAWLLLWIDNSCNFWVHYSFSCLSLSIFSSFSETAINSCEYVYSRVRNFCTISYTSENPANAGQVFYGADGSESEMSLPVDRKSGQFRPLGHDCKSKLINLCKIYINNWWSIYFQQFLTSKCNFIVDFQIEQH